ncbi:MAG TPA: helix-turn-helix domain-containing protein [Chthoniobacterales bacterium]|nr:helix-turn-helix domain-containing protein [Chthoniobacterales bacterium]
MATLGDRMRECREARGWRLEDLAQKAGVSKSFLSDLENNEQKNPGVNYLRLIAGALGVDLHYLTTGQGARVTARNVTIPASLLELAKDEQLTVNQTMMLLDARRQIVSHRSNGTKSDDLESFDWRPFYQALKPYLK